MKSINGLKYLALCVLIFMVACFTYDVADYTQYALFYEKEETGALIGYHMEAGYVLLERIGNALHLNFPVFRGIYIGVALCPLLVSIYEYTGKCAFYCLMLYAIYPFLFDVVQMRHLMAVSISVYCLRYLGGKSKWDIVRYCAGIFIAASQHTVALFYLCFLAVLIKCSRRAFYSVTASLMIIGMVVMSRLNSGGAISKIYEALLSGLHHFRGSGKFSLDKTEAVSKYYLLMFGLMLFLLLAIHGYKRGQFFVFRLSIRKTQPVDFDLLFRVSAISLMFIPLVNINDHLSRANRGFLVIVYATLVMYAHSGRANSLKRIVFHLLPLSVACVCFIMFLSARSITHWETVTVPVFTNNYIMDALQHLFIGEAN